MSLQISKTHLAFVQEAKEAFENNSILETYRNDDDTYIALRMGHDRDCIMVYEIDSPVANFVQQMEQCPRPRKEVQQFAYDMEKQLKVNDHKGGWRKEHDEFLVRQLDRNLNELAKVLIADDKDKHEITIRCANIANFAMMIADNEGEHL